MPQTARARPDPAERLGTIQHRLDELAVRMDPLTRMWMALEPKVHALQREIRRLERATGSESVRDELRRARQHLEPLLPGWLGVKRALHRFHREARRVLHRARGVLRAAVGPKPGAGSPQSFLRLWEAPRPGPGPLRSCPVAGPSWFVSSFGAPRSGGRTHQGEDLFAARGTPVLAVADGMVEPVPNSLGGRAVYLHGSGGTRWYYAHLSAYGRTGPVSSGDVIGYVGTSGNARGNAPHLHFEHRPGGMAVNPFAELLLAC